MTGSRSTSGSCWSAGTGWPACAVLPDRRCADPDRDQRPAGACRADGRRVGVARVVLAQLRAAVPRERRDGRPVMIAAPTRVRDVYGRVSATRDSDLARDVALLGARIALAWIFIYHGAGTLFGAFGGSGIAPGVHVLRDGRPPPPGHVLRGAGRHHRAVRRHRRRARHLRPDRGRGSRRRHGDGHGDGDVQQRDRVEPPPAAATSSTWRWPRWPLSSPCSGPGASRSTSPCGRAGSELLGRHRSVPSAGPVTPIGLISRAAPAPSLDRAAAPVRGAVAGDGTGSRPAPIVPPGRRGSAGWPSPSSPPSQWSKQSGSLAQRSHVVLVRGSGAARARRTASGPSRPAGRALQPGRVSSARTGGVLPAGPVRAPPRTGRARVCTSEPSSSTVPP